MSNFQPCCCCSCRRAPKALKALRTAGLVSAFLCATTSSTTLFSIQSMCSCSYQSCTSTTCLLSSPNKVLLTNLFRRRANTSPLVPRSKPPASTHPSYKGTVSNSLHAASQFPLCINTMANLNDSPALRHTIQHKSPNSVQFYLGMVSMVMVLVAPELLAIFPDATRTESPGTANPFWRQKSMVYPILVISVS